MSMKNYFRFFTIADFEEEEQWLREQHRNGWKLVKATPPCMYLFEECVPEDVIYKLDYKNGEESKDYYQIFSDYGWEYVTKCVGWLYFRKPVREVESENDAEIFSDRASRLAMVEKILRTRLLPITILFLCCVIPNTIRYVSVKDAFSLGFSIFWVVMFGIYVYLIGHCGWKIRKIRNDLEET